MGKKFIKALTGYLMLMLMSSALFAQDVDPRLKLWDEKIVEEARKAATAEFLSKTEVEIVFLHNLIRSDGELFYQTFVEAYEEMKDQASDNYIRSLKKDLKGIKGLPLLYPKRDLTKAAADHAERMGKLGSTGHENYKSRMSSLSAKYKSLGENIDYQRENALDIVMSLLIDRGIADLGHRKNILNPLFNSIGLASAAHKKYVTNCVIELAEL